VDCESLERCKCNCVLDTTPKAHFEIPQLILQFGKSAIEYMGSTDRMNKFKIITSLSELENKKYRKRGNNKPYVWIDFAPNENGMLDCFLFNAPLLKQVSVVGAFKDPRQIEKYQCCTSAIDDLSLTGIDDNISYISQLVKEKLTAEKLQYYRQLVAPNLPNNQIYTSGN